MRYVGVFSCLFIFVLLAVFANAATIYGSVYDLSLKKVSNAFVEINTTPKQLIVANNGSYSFTVGNGAYAIKSQISQKNTVLAFVQENITIKQNGSYVLDLILFPDVEEGVEDIGINVDNNIVDIRKNYTLLVAVFAVVIAAALFFYFNRIKKAEKEIEKIEDVGVKVSEEKYDDELEHLVKIIKNEGGRATQKDIRKQIPLSEAKISLMIAELEHKGIIEKIKKGRGNIIILKK